MRDDRHKLRAVSISAHGTGGYPEKCETYTWFSPLGEKNHEATHMATITARPMKMEYLTGTSYVSL